MRMMTARKPKRGEAKVWGLGFSEESFEAGVSARVGIL